MTGQCDDRDAVRLTVVVGRDGDEVGVGQQRR